jgi:hypothetical protein
MNNKDSTFCVRASYSGYIVFGVLLLPTCFLYLWLLGVGKLQGQEHVVFVPWAILLPFYIWLAGFKIRITSETFEYRDGLWRWHCCLRSQVNDVKIKHVEFKNFGRVLSFPRMVIRCSDNSKILINIKPFSRKALKDVTNLLSS